MDKTSIQEDIIKFCEAQGKASKSKIEDYLKETKGTTGDCVSRRIRELVADGVVAKTARTYEEKKYWEYRVVDQDVKKTPNYEWNHPTKDERVVGIITVTSTEDLPKLNL